MYETPTDGRRGRGPLTVATIAVVLAISLVASPLTPSAPATAATTSTPSTAAVKSSHPRLLADSARITQLRAQQSQDPASRALADRVLEEARVLRSAPRIDYKLSNGRMLSAATELVDRTYTLVVAWTLSGDKAYLDLLWKDLGVATQLRSWNPDHMLDGAELTHAAAIAYDWAYGSWSSTQRSELRTAILKLGLEPATKIYNLPAGGKTPYRFLGNWWEEAVNVNTTINAAMIMGSLAIAKDSTSTTVQSVLTGATKSIRRGLSEFQSDGGFPEGPTYWAYATRSATTALLSLKSATGSDYGLTAVGGLSKTGAFGLDLRSADDALYNFADSSSLPGVVNLPLAGLARLYGKPELGAASAVAISGSYTRAAQQLIMRDPAWKDASPATSSLNASYATGVVTARSSTTSADATYVAFRSAAGFDNFHQHLDPGDFQLAALGQEWAVELGTEKATYDIADRANSSARWDYYRTSTIGHNTLTINPAKPGAARTMPTKAGIVSSSPDEFFATTDATATFGASVSSWKRGVRLFNSRTQALVQDEVTSASATDALWGMHTRAVIDISTDGRQAVLSQNGERLLARIVSGSGAAFTDMPASALPTSPQPSQEANTDVRRLSIWFPVKAGETTTLAVQFTPLPPGTDASAAPSAARVTALSSWKPMGAATTLTNLTVGGKPVTAFSGRTSSYDVTIADPSSLPRVAATGPGKVTVVQATTSTMAARVTVTTGTARPTTYLVRFLVVGSPAVVEGRVAGDPRSRTVDGRPETVWDPASVSSRSLIWRFGTGEPVRLVDPVPLRSVMLTMSSSSFTTTHVSLEMSVDGVTWSTPTTGTFTGPTATKSFAVSSDAPVKFVRLSVPRGDAKIAEAVFLRHDASGENVSRPGTVPTSTILAALDTTPDVGATARARTTTKWSGSAGSTTTRWVTSDPKVVSISSDGTWRALSRGSARVGAIVTSSDGVSVTATAGITVTDPTRIRIPVSRDSFVAGSEPSKNFGSSAVMLNKPTTSAAIERIGYLAFDLTPIMGREVRSAVLTVPTAIKDNANVPTARIDLHTVSGTWTESGITYATRPKSGATVASLLATKTDQPQSADLTKSLAALVASQTRTASYSLSQDNAGSNAVVVSMPTKESGTGAYIEVVLAPANADPVPPTRLGSVGVAGAPSGLVVGKSVTITAKPKDSTGGTFTRARVTYASSDSSIIKVSSTGVLTGLKKGWAAVTVSATADGITVIWTSRITVANS